jgi:hypothetical protein
VTAMKRRARTGIREILRLVLPGLALAIIGTGILSVQWTGPQGRWCPAVAHAQEDWKKEFEDICSQTQDAMTLSIDELRNLVGRCDKLKLQIEKLEGPARKVYLKRLQLCRDLFAFVLESKQKE